MFGQQKTAISGGLLHIRADKARSILFRSPINDSIEIVNVFRESSPAKCSHLRLKSNYHSADEGGYRL